MALRVQPHPDRVLDGRRLVFLGGLHRSGTTPLARALAAHPDISGMVGTGQPRDEGQHVQSVYPAANAHGGAGSFALRSRAHLDEGDTSPEAAARLSAQWSPYWDLDRPLLLEKSPPNLIRMRFLQAAFPGAAFVVIVRHPVVVTLATRKWSRRSTGHLLRNWIAGHSALARDARHVHRLFLLSYEDLTADPVGALTHLLQWLGLGPLPTDRVPDLRSTNAHYLARWQADRRRPLRGSYLANLERRLAPQTRALGYDIGGTRPQMTRWIDRAPTATVHATGTAAT